MLKKITAILASAVMLLSLASCANTDWVIKNGDVTVTSGIYLGFLTESTLYELSEHGADSVDALMKMTIHEKKADEYIKEQALDLCKTYIAVEQKFKELGLALAAEDEEEIDSTLATYKSYYGTYFSDNGCGDASLRAIIENNIKLEKIFYHYYGEDGEKAVSKSEKQTYFTENYARIQYIPVYLTDATTGADLEGDDLTKAKEEAESYYNRAVAGEDFITLLNEYLKESGDTETEYTSEIQENGFTKADSIVPKENSSYPEAVNTAVYEMQVGEVRKVEADSLLFIIKKLDINESEKAYESYEETVLTAMKSEEFSTSQTEWKNALEYEINDTSISRYSPKKLEFETASY